MNELPEWPLIKAAVLAAGGDPEATERFGDMPVSVRYWHGGGAQNFNSGFTWSDVRAGCGLDLQPVHYFYQSDKRFGRLLPGQTRGYTIAGLRNELLVQEELF